MTKSSVKRWNFSTKAIHVGNEADETTGAVSPPIHLTSTYLQDGVGNDRGYDYSRVVNPTRQRLEKNLAALEDCQFGITFTTGMAAITTLFQPDSIPEYVRRDVPDGHECAFQAGT
jgi:cystathionine beta-lyase/cystathionine gamma-synthase